MPNFFDEFGTIESSALDNGSSAKQCGTAAGTRPPIGGIGGNLRTDVSDRAKAQPNNTYKSAPGGRSSTLAALQMQADLIVPDQKLHPRV